MIENGAHRVYRVDDLTVDVARARVLRGESEVVLPKLSFDLLLALIERAPAIVSNDDMMAAVWPGLVVSPETITQRVKLLREALGDDSRNPRYVAGVRGRGYRLVPDVQRLVPGQAAGPVAQPALRADAAPQTKSVRAWLLAAGGFALVAMLVALVTVLRAPTTPREAHSSPSLPARSIAVLPFESLSDTQRCRVLSLGVAESVLHQLASLRELSVIARTSSFAIAGQDDLDARAIGNQLNARYLLEGSVQDEDGRLRVTAQLIDATSGDHVWSMRFDRASQDVFALQDEIAIEVARALRLSLDAPAADRLRARRAASFDAYLAYLQGRALAISLRFADMKAAAAHFESALRADPGFASAYVELAAARLHVAEFDVTPGRGERFAKARLEGEGLIAKALALDPANGEAYAVRAYLTAFGDLQGAERDYRRSIELSPNNAAAFAGLAAVLYETVDKRDEALAMLERARQLDPLEPRYAVTKAVFLMFWRGQVSPALAELRGVVERDPLYQPALARYGEALGCLDGQQAEGIKYLEQAIDLDPDAASTVSLLIQGYINLREVAAAEQVVEDIGHGMPSRRLYLQLYRRQWRAAGESAYAAFADGTMIPYDGRLGSIAVRMHARETKSFVPAIALLEEQAGVTWDASGQPRFPMQTGVAVATVALGDMLIADGQLERGRRLLRASLADMDRVMRDYGRTDLWYGPDRAIALALLGEDAAALAEIRRASAAYGGCSWWAFLNTEPAFEKVRNDPEFKSVLAKVLERTAKESASLARMREAGLVPKRPGATSGG